MKESFYQRNFKTNTHEQATIYESINSEGYSFKKCRGNICHYIIGKVYLFLCFEFKAHLKDKGQSGCEQIIWTPVQNKALNPNDKFVVQN